MTPIIDLCREHRVRKHQLGNGTLLWPPKTTKNKHFRDRAPKKISLYVSLPTPIPAPLPFLPPHPFFIHQPEVADRDVLVQFPGGPLLWSPRSWQLLAPNRSHCSDVSRQRPLSHWSWLSSLSNSTLSMAQSER